LCCKSTADWLIITGSVISLATVGFEIALVKNKRRDGWGVGGEGGGIIWIRHGFESLDIAV
jgi:hypothetical protein